MRIASAAVLVTWSVRQADIGQREPDREGGKAANGNGQISCAHAPKAGSNYEKKQRH